MIGQTFRSHTGLERTVVGHVKSIGGPKKILVREERRGEFVMTVVNFNRWVKERRCVLVEAELNKNLD